MAIELRRRGVLVDIYTPNPGRVSRRLGNTVTRADLSQTPKGWYEAAFVNHWPCLDVISPLGIAQKVVLTLHGPAHRLERPKRGADIYVSVSEEIQRAASEDGFLSEVIRNGVDLSRFSPRRPLSPTLRRVGLLSNYRRAEKGVAMACEIAGCEFMGIGGSSYREDVASAINECDLIVSVGRGAMEAMACGRALVIYDNRGYYPNTTDGYFTPAIGHTSRGCNYTGRALKVPVTPHSLADLLMQYDASHGPVNREYCEQHHDVRDQVGRYLALIDGQSTASAPRTVSLVSRMDSMPLEELEQ